MVGIKKESMPQKTVSAMSLQDKNLYNHALPFSNWQSNVGRKGEKRQAKKGTTHKLELISISKC